MDKSPSIHCQDVEDDSWDLEENEGVPEFERMSSNSWDSSFEQDGKQCQGVEEFHKEETIEDTPWASCERIVKPMEKSVLSEGDGTSVESEKDQVQVKWTDNELVVEDLEEHAEGSPDISVWEIPITERTISTTDSDVTIELIGNLKSGKIIRTCKSETNTKAPIKEKKCRSCDDLPSKVKWSPKEVLMQFDGYQRGLKKIDLGELYGMGDASHYQEIECRTLVSKPTCERDDTKDGEEEQCNTAGSSRTSDEAASLPNIAASVSRKGSHEFRKTASHTTNQSPFCDKAVSSLTESWILLDETGQSQPVTLTEVNFLLNGRSADTVLQENQEHFVPRNRILRNASSDLQIEEWKPLVEESLQHFLHEEDRGGEESASKPIGLERKFGNMLLYIQSGVNLTSSVRFIPVDTDMIHMWRQSRDNVSPSSSEDESRAAESENLVDDSSGRENQSSEGGILAMKKARSSVRKQRTRQNKAEDCEHRSTENRRIIDSLTSEIRQLRMRLDAEKSRSTNLEKENHLLRGQLDKCKSEQSGADVCSVLITEEYRKGNGSCYTAGITSSSLMSIEELRHECESRERQQEKCGLSLSASNEQNFKQALDRNINDIEEILKCENSSPVKGGKTILPSGGTMKKQILDDNSGISSSDSMNTFAVMEATSQVLSETTGSSYSCFKAKKPTDGQQRNISEILYEMERENERLVTENLNLKKKLNEISLELDEYITSSMVLSPGEEGRQAESLRNEVYNLKLELENLKSLAKNKEQSYKIKNAIVREELAEKCIILEEWRTSTMTIFHAMDESREQLNELGVPSPCPKVECPKLTPKNILQNAKTLLDHFKMTILELHRENSILRKTPEKTVCKGDVMFGVEQNTSHDVKFTEEDQGLVSKPKSTENRFQEEEIKNLLRENNFLLEYQLEHNEKLKNVSQALREEKSKADSLEKIVKIMEIEKEEIMEALASSQKERTEMEGELQRERSRLEELEIECETRKSEAKQLEEKLQQVMEKFHSFDESSTLKDDIIKELKSNCSELKSRESLHDGQVQFLNEQLKKLESERSKLEEELESTKHIAEESRRGMTEYITHLETMVGNAEDNVLEMRDKYNETLRSLRALKKTHEELQMQNATNTKMYNRTKNDLDNCMGAIKDLEEKNKSSEEARRKALCDLNTISNLEREKTETLEKMVLEMKALEEEMVKLKMNVETQEKEKDKFLKEQKDFMNEIAILRKEKQRLGQKYRNVKSECNERTKLMRRLNGKMKENFLEYNKRIACLEENVNNIMQKALAYKGTFLEKKSEEKTMMRELQKQLNIVNLEKRDLESEAANFYAAMEHLQREVNENKAKEKFLFEKMGTKCGDHERITIQEESDENSSLSNLRKELENQVQRAEAHLAGSQEKVRQLEIIMEEERNKYESVIADLKNQISRYQVRLEVMLKNISTLKNDQEGMTDKRNSEDGLKITTLEGKVRELTDEVEKKRRQLLEMTELMERNESAMKKKGDECEVLKEKVEQLKGEIRNMKGQFSKLQDFLSTIKKNVENYQKERDEVAGRLAKSLELIVEERASKQSSQVIFAEKEKMLKEQVEQMQGRLTEKKEEYEILLKTMEGNKTLISKLQEDVKKWKCEAGMLKAQVCQFKEQNALRRESDARQDSFEGDGNQRCVSLELRDLRTQNLELRKVEGSLRATLVRVEDELRNARLLIRELEGDLKSEKTSKRLLKEMIMAARKEIEKCKRGGQIIASIADKIERHFNLSRVQSREMLSGYRTGGEDPPKFIN